MSSMPVSLRLLNLIGYVIPYHMSHDYLIDKQNQYHVVTDPG